VVEKRPEEGFEIKEKIKNKKKIVMGAKLHNFLESTNVL
jgi:hypothetical protein